MIKEKFNLTGKVAIITGASKGIGEAMARGMAAFGAMVVVSSRLSENNGYKYQFGNGIE